MAYKKLGEFATPNDDYLRAPITQPEVVEENYQIKPNLLNLIQQTQFGGSASRDAGLGTSIPQIPRVTCLGF